MIQLGGIVANVLVLTVNKRSNGDFLLLFLLNGLSYVWRGVRAFQFGMLPIPLIDSSLRLWFISRWGRRWSRWRGHFWWVHMNSIRRWVIVTKGPSHRIEKLHKKDKEHLSSTSEWLLIVTTKINIFQNNNKQNQTVCEVTWVNFWGLKLLYILGLKIITHSLNTSL